MRSICWKVYSKRRTSVLSGVEGKTLGEYLSIIAIVLKMIYLVRDVDDTAERC